MLHEDLKRFFDGFPRDAHPMPVLSSRGVARCRPSTRTRCDPFDQEQVELSTIRLLAKLPTIAAYAYKKSVGQPFLYPDNSLGLVENFLRMTFGFPAEPYEVDPDLVHGAGPAVRSCTPTTSRTARRRRSGWSARRRRTCSPRSRPASTPCSGRCTAARTRRCWRCCERSAGDGGDVDTFVKRVKNKEPGVKLMGFGHRVYKNYDPRAAIVKATADEVLPNLGVNDQLLDIAKQLEEVALSDDYFISRKLYPNVDFYTGLIYKAMGFPTKMFTVLFALGRLPGWIAQWREMINDPATKIGRPRQVYTGPTERDYTPIDRALISRARSRGAEVRLSRRGLRARGRLDHAARGSTSDRDRGMTSRSSGSAATCGSPIIRRCSPPPTAAHGCARRCSFSTTRCWNRPGRRGGPSCTGACARSTRRWTAGCWSCTGDPATGAAHRRARRRARCTSPRTTVRTAAAGTTAVEEALRRQDIELVRTGSPYAVAPGRVRKADGDAVPRCSRRTTAAGSDHGWRAPADRRGRAPLDRPGRARRPRQADPGRRAGARRDELRRPARRAAPRAGRSSSTRPSPTTTTTRNRPDRPGTPGCRRT